MPGTDLTVAWTRRVWVVLSATFLQERCAPIETGSPLCPSDHHHCPLLGTSLAVGDPAGPCSHAAMQQCSNAAIVGAARRANVRHPMCHCQGPAGPGFVRFLGGVWWCMVVYGGCVSSDTVVVHSLSIGRSTQPLLLLLLSFLLLVLAPSLVTPVSSSAAAHRNKANPVQRHCCKSDGHGHIRSSSRILLCSDGYRER